MKTYLLTLSYDGTAYSGWQRQKNARTVQQEVEEALYRLTGFDVSVTASGRTDEGVHALGQAVSFSCELPMPAANAVNALNGKLPHDIRAVNCREVAAGFCARRSAKRKTYAYRFYVSPAVVPQIDRYALRLGSPLDTELLTKAAKKIEGTHDFKEFYCLGSSAKTTVRTVYSCNLTEYAENGIMPLSYELRICGNGFLYKMVRLLTGALLRLNGGEISLAEFEAALNGEGTLRKIPAPSKGLTLAGVEYD